MNDVFFDTELRKFFSKSSLEDWKKIAVSETGGKDPFEALVWKGKDNISFLPYYDSEVSGNFSSVAQPAENQTQRVWLNLPLVTAQNPRRSNTLALEHLMNGADGIMCDVRSISHPDLKVLTNNIQWAHCYIGFYTGEHVAFIQSLQEIVQHLSSPATVNGALFWESVPKTGNVAFYLKSCPSFKALGLNIPTSTPAGEICEALLRGVRALDVFGKQGAFESVFDSIAFSLSADGVLLETVAKFKALRMLWFQIARAYNYEQYMPEALFLHARSGFVSDDAFGPHQNMIKGTFAAMGALMGGCNSLTVESDADIPFAARCARNVSSILREESFFDRAADPLRGAWSVEAITHAIAKKAWDLFQQKSKTDATA